MPLVSVVLPIYNAEDYLGQAMESLLSQSMRDWEAWLIDDGSTDRSAEIMEYYARRDNRVRGVILRANHGIANVLNMALETVNGRYMARMDADDLMSPRRLEAQVEIMDAQPEIVICGSSYRTIDRKGNPGLTVEPPLTDTAIRWEALFHCPFAHPSVMIRLETIHRFHLRYCPEARSVEDYDLWVRMLNFGRGINLSEPLLQYRVHSGQVSRQDSAFQQQAAGRISQAQLAALGVELPLDQVQVLRSWYQRFPSKLEEEDEFLGEAIFRILERFEQLPLVDPGVYNAIRGRWLARFMLTPGGRKGSWRKFMRPNDWWLVAGHVKNRLFGLPGVLAVQSL